MRRSPSFPSGASARRLSSFAAALTLLGASALAAPATAAQRSDDATRESAEDARALKRILYLRGSGALRTIARRNGDAWEVKQGADWSAIPAESVARVALEKDVLAAWRSELAAARRADDPSAERAAAVASAFEAGLYQEALDEAELLLRDAPRDEAARAAVLDHAHLLGVPAVERDEVGRPDFETVLKWASPRGRALREVAVLRLVQGGLGDASAGQSAYRDTLRSTLAEELVHVLPRRRSFAALAIGRIFPGEAVRELLVHSLRDASEDVRAEAAIALGAANEPGLVLPLVKVLATSSSPSMRRHAAAALGHTGYRTAVEPLVSRLSALAAPSSAQGASGGRVPHSHIFVGRQFAYIQDFDVEVAQLQSVADPQVNVLMEGGVLDAGVIGTLEYRSMVAAERTAIQRSLQQITGENPGGFARDWIRWWEERGASSGDLPASNAGR